MADPRQSVIHGEPHSWDVSGKRYWVWPHGDGYILHQYPDDEHGNSKVEGDPIYPVAKTLAELALLLKE